MCFYIYVYILVYLYISKSEYQYTLQAYVRIVTVPPVQVCSLEMLLALWVCSYIYVHIFTSMYLYINVHTSVYQCTLQAYVRIVKVPPVQVCSLEMSLALWVCP